MSKPTGNKWWHMVLAGAGISIALSIGGVEGFTTEWIVAVALLLAIVVAVAGARR